MFRSWFVYTKNLCNSFQCAQRAARATFRIYGSTATTTTITIRASVGGVVLPANNLTVLAPYLAIIGLVTVAASVYVTKRRR